MQDGDRIIVGECDSVACLDSVFNDRLHLGDHVIFLECFHYGLQGIHIRVDLVAQRAECLECLVGRNLEYCSVSKSECHIVRIAAVDVAEERV